MSRRGGGNIPNQGGMLPFGLCSAGAAEGNSYRTQHKKTCTRTKRPEGLQGFLSLLDDSKMYVALWFFCPYFTNPDAQSTKGFIQRMPMYWRKASRISLESGISSALSMTTLPPSALMYSTIRSTFTT